MLNFANRRSLIAGFALLSISRVGDAMPAPDRSEPVPISRLVENVSRYIQKYPARAEGYYAGPHSQHRFRAARPDARAHRLRHSWRIGEKRNSGRRLHPKNHQSDSPGQSQSLDLFHKSASRHSEGASATEESRVALVF